MDQTGTDWLLLGGVSASGMFRLYSREQRFKLDAGWTALCFGPVNVAGAGSPPASDAKARQAGESAGRSESTVGG